MKNASEKNVETAVQQVDTMIGAAKTTIAQTLGRERLRSRYFEHAVWFTTCGHCSHRYLYTHICIVVLRFPFLRSRFAVVTSSAQTHTVNVILTTDIRA